MTRTRLGTTLLGVLALALATAFVLLPAPAAAALTGRGYGDEQHLALRVTSAFVAYWQSGRGALTPELSDLVTYWRVYLGVKALTSVGLLVVLVVLAVRFWTTYARAGTRAARAAVAGGVVTMLAVAAFVAALATVQGTVAPFSSLMSMLPVRSAHGDVAVMVAQVQEGLAHYPAGSSGALRTMVDDLARYHVVVAVISWAAAAALVVLPVVRWRTAARRDRRARRLLGLSTIASVLMAALVAVLAVANTTAAVDSPTAVLNFYRGSF